MRRLVALIGTVSVATAFALLVWLGITAKSSGELPGVMVVVALALALAISTGYQTYRLLQHTAGPGFPRENLQPIAALLIFGALIGLAMVAGAVSDGAHGMGLLLPGFLIHLVTTCVARYKFAT
jgi:hypothetical protein